MPKFAILNPGYFCFTIIGTLMNSQTKALKPFHLLLMMTGLLQRNINNGIIL